MKHITQLPLVIRGVTSLLALILLPQDVLSACVVSADNLTTTCSGNISPSSSTDAGKAVSVYDPAAAAPYSATKFNPNPPIVTVNNGANFQFINPTTTNLFDKGIIGANFPNSENPAVNNWVLNNAGTINLSTNSIANRLQAVISDSQVNQLTVNNSANGVISASQTFFSNFNSSLLGNTVSSAGVNTGTYNGATFNPISAIYTDDNTNALVLKNDGSITTNGNFAAAVYGRAGDQTIINNGFLGNNNWVASDSFFTGHWAIGNYGGAEFQTVANSNPDTPIYNVYSSGGQHFVDVTSDSQTTIVNSGTIKGDILMLDASPLTMAAALANGAALPVANSGTNSGPRDSDINNSGTINGNFYLGSGTHQIVNTGSINGNINVDQSPSLGAFAVGTVGTQAGTYASLGAASTSANTNQPCPIGNTTDPSCAASSNVMAYFAGTRTVNLNNSGILAGSVNITNTTAASQITIGTGIAVNGAGTTLNAPSTATAIQGTLAISGAANANNISLQPVIQTIVKNNTWYEVANKVSGNILNAGNVSQLAVGADTGLVTWQSALNANNNLVVGASVKDANALAGISSGAANTVNALDGYSGSNAQLLALGGQVQSLPTDAAARVAAEQLRPEINGATSQTILNSSNNLMRILDNHLTEGHMAGFMGAAYASTNPANQPSSSQRGRSSGNDASSGYAGQLYRDLGANPGFWLQGITQHQQQGTRQGVDGYNGNTNGFALGFDTHLGDHDQWVVGAMFSTSRSNISAVGVNAGNTDSIGSNQGFLYSSWRPGKAYVNAIVGVGGNDIKGSRFALYQGLNSSRNAMQYSARVDTGMPFQTDYATLIPTAYFSYSRLNQSGYTETGDSAALHVDATNMNSARTGLGGKAVVPLYEGGLPWTHGIVQGALEFSALWSHEFADTSAATNANFAVASDSPLFYVPGKGAGRDSGLFGAGARLSFAEIDGIRPSVLLNYFAEVKDQYTSNTGMVQGRIDF